jgi:hypothetical protein
LFVLLPTKEEEGLVFSIVDVRYPNGTPEATPVIMLLIVAAVEILLLRRIDRLVISLLAIVEPVVFVQKLVAE